MFWDFSFVFFISTNIFCPVAWIRGVNKSDARGRKSALLPLFFAAPN